ncbi:MAG: PAS domain S-box protein [Acidobacteriota bacterium]|nr:PAS domain S-box protein [Acidobacteriota bacterium]
MFNRRRAGSSPSNAGFAPPSAGTDLFPLDKPIGEMEAIALPVMDVPLFMEMSPAAIFLVSLKGIIIDCNKAAADLFGYPNRFDLVGMRADQLLDPREYEAAVRGLAVITDLGLFSNRECLCRKGTGESFDALVSARIVRGTTGDPAAILVIGQDISRSKSQERAVTESETRFRILFESSADGVFLVDQRGRAVTANRQGGLLLGVPLEDIAGCTANEFIIGEDAEAISARFESLKRGEDVPAVERTLRRRDGVKLPVEIRGALVKDADGRVYGIQYVIRDLTDRKRAEAEQALIAGQLRKALGNIINVVAATVEMRDPGTAGHQKRVANLARAVGTEMGLDATKIEAIRFAGVIHDVGKTSIPAEILSKPGRLSEAERRLVREHARFGFEILKNVEFPWPIAEIVHQHHERLDGSGYPRGLQGDQILIEAQIIGAADVIEAMASHRPYRPALGIGAALDELRSQRGKQFDIAVVDACLKVFAEKKVPLL